MLLRRRRTIESSTRPIIRRKEIPKERIWSVSASSDHSWPACWIANPYNVLDCDETRVWNSRSFAPAWIRFDLGPSCPCVSRIDLMSSMDPGPAEHRILMGTHLSAMETVMIIGGECREKWLECLLPQSRRTQYVEIHTMLSPGWVSWARIRIWTE